MYKFNLGMLRILLLGTVSQDTFDVELLNEAPPRSRDRHTLRVPYHE